MVKPVDAGLTTSSREPPKGPPDGVHFRRFGLRTVPLADRTPDTVLAAAFPIPTGLLASQWEESVVWDAEIPDFHFENMFPLGSFQLKLKYDA